MKLLSLIFIQILINFGESNGKLSWKENQHRLDTCGGADLKQNLEWYWKFFVREGSTCFSSEAIVISDRHFLASAMPVMDEKMKWRGTTTSVKCLSGSEHLKVPEHVLAYYTTRLALDHNTQSITKIIRPIDAHILKGCNQSIKNEFEFQYSLMLVEFEWVQPITVTHVYPCIADDQTIVREKEKLDLHTVENDKTVKVGSCEDSKHSYTMYNMGWFYPDICSMAGLCSLKDADSLLTTTMAPKTSTTITKLLTTPTSSSRTTFKYSTTSSTTPGFSKSEESSNYDPIAFYMFREVKEREDMNLEVSMNSSCFLEQISMFSVFLIWVVVNKC